MSDRTFEDRVRDAHYRAMVTAYQQRHKNDAEKEPEETELERMARITGAPAPHTMPVPKLNPSDALNRRLVEAFFDD